MMNTHGYRPLFFRPASRPRPGLLWFVVGLAILAAVLLPLNLLVTRRFHHDEALYATWALQIASGQNPWLAHIPIDKPPLFLYAAAASMRLLGITETAARLPSLLATAATVGLTFRLGRRLYGPAVGLLAAWLAALSPFTIMFAATAFTDPMLAALVLAGCLAAVSGRPGWAGMWLGLAVAAKQQGLFFVPLGLGLLVVAGSPRPEPALPRGVWPPGRRLHAARLAAGLAVTLAPVFIWDAARGQSPGFWQLSVVNYGGLAPGIAAFGERWAGFVDLLRFGTASPVLNTLFLAGLPLLLLYGLGYAMIHGRHTGLLQAAKVDGLLVIFSLLFLLGHAGFSFQVWDRYLLGLIPLLALLLARILLLPWTVLSARLPPRRPYLVIIARGLVCIGLAALLAVTLARPVQDAANGRYPLGSNSQALQGVEQIVAYLQGHVGANNTLYHRWLGTHWRFYLWRYPYDLQYWPSPAALAAAARPGHLIAFPTWQSETEARLALAGAGLELQELVRAYTPAGHPSIILYRIVQRPE